MEPLYKYCRLSHSTKTHKTGHRIVFGADDQTEFRCGRWRPTARLVFTDRKPYPADACRKCFTMLELRSAE